MRIKKQYIKPEIKWIKLDFTISLQMISPPHDPPPVGGSKGNNNKDPFASPFGNKPFG